MDIFIEISLITWDYGDVTAVFGIVKGESKIPLLCCNRKIIIFFYQCWIPPPILLSTRTIPWCTLSYSVLVQAILKPIVSLANFVTSLHALFRDSLCVCWTVQVLGEISTAVLKTSHRCENWPFLRFTFTLLSNCPFTRESSLVLDNSLVSLEVFSKDLVKSFLES